MAGMIVNFEKLREQAAAERWSNRALAHQTGLSNQAVSLILRGRVDPKATTLKKICDVIGLPIEEVFIESGAA